jgi:hypothetical protein
LTVVAALTVLLSRLLTLDDAYITFRYARHLAQGYGLGAWNRTGEHVEGYSSLLWTLLLGGAAWLGEDVRIASKIFGTAAALIVIAVLFRRRDDRPAVLTGVFLALYLPFTFYAASGMEAVAFTSLVTLALVGPAQWQPGVAPLLIAMRPEGALVAAVDVLALAWRRERWRWVAATAIAGGLTLMAAAVRDRATRPMLRGSGQSLAPRRRSPAATEAPSVYRGCCPHRRAWTEHALHREARHVRSRLPPGLEDRHALGHRAAP